MHSPASHTASPRRQAFSLFSLLLVWLAHGFQLASAAIAALPQWSTIAAERDGGRLGWFNLTDLAPPLGTATTTVPGPTKTNSVPFSEENAAANGDYKLHQSNRGRDFFDNWTFWTKDDPTHGQVRYVSREMAEEQGLIGFTDQGRAWASTSNGDIPEGNRRHSVRLHSEQTYDAALVIFDVTHMPVGCATWPALWLCNGDDWPVNGEIDVVEGIGYTSVGKKSNLMSVHLAEEAFLTTKSGSYTGTLNSNDCMTEYGMGNTGCSFRDNNGHGPSWGNDFNQQHGGIWALQFGSNQGVKIWFWGRHSGTIPHELSQRSQAPQKLSPSTFGVPMANFQADAINRQILGQQIIMDITIGGDWAGATNMDGNCGNDLKAAIAKGKNYDEAFWRFNGIDVYCPATGC